MSFNPVQANAISSCSVRIFGPKLPAVGIDGTLWLEGDRLCVDAGRSHKPSLGELKLREIGFGKPGIELSWNDSEGAWAAHVLSPAVAASLLADPRIESLTQVRALRSQQQRLKHRRLIGWTLLGTVLALPLLLLVLFYANADRIAEWISNRIPIDQERSFGQEAFDGMRQQLHLKDEGPAYNIVNELGQRLTVGSNYRYEFHIADDAEINAFAIPGGFVVVNLGLIKATRRPEELAGVLAHEVQHVEQRHSLRSLIKQSGLQALWLMASGDLGTTFAGQTALQLASLKFSRDAESEADTKGLQTLVRQGIDPSGMPAFFRIMSEKLGDAPIGYLSTHPLNAEREDRLTAQIKSLNGLSFAPLPAAGWPPD